jgi:hypothetical protein
VTHEVFLHKILIIKDLRRNRPLLRYNPNHLERMLRAGALWRKNAFGSPSEGGCRFAERLLTVVQTLRLQKRPILEFLYQSLSTHRSGCPAPRLLPG